MLRSLSPVLAIDNEHHLANSTLCTTFAVSSILNLASTPGDDHDHEILIGCGGEFGAQTINIFSRAIYDVISELPHTHTNIFFCL